jgi:hypothetical protein
MTMTPQLVFHQSFEYARTPPSKEPSIRKKTFSVPQIHVHTEDSKISASNNTTKEIQGEITFVPFGEEKVNNSADAETNGNQYQVPVPVFNRRSPPSKNSSRCFTVSEHDELLCSKIFSQCERSPVVLRRDSSRTNSNHSIDICFVPFGDANENESNVNNTKIGDEDCPKRKELSDSSDSTLSRSRRILNESASKLVTEN